MNLLELETRMPRIFREELEGFPGPVSDLTGKCGEGFPECSRSVGRHKAVGSSLSVLPALWSRMASSASFSKAA